MDVILLNTLISYFKAEKIKVSPTELELQLFTHPHTPSLYAISETLNFLNIENVAAQVEAHQLDQLSEHFVAFISDDSGKEKFYHVQQREDQIYIHGKKKLITKETFKNVWNGIILIAEQSKNIEKINTNTWINKGFIALISILALVFLWGNAFTIIFCILGVLGLYVSNQIFETQNDKSSYLGDKICGTEEENGCSKILNISKYNLYIFTPNQLLFSFLSAAMISVILTTSFTPIHIALYTAALLAIISLLCIQGFVVKSWCKLCLLSSLIITLQFGTILLNSNFTYVSTDYFWSSLFLKEMVLFILFFSILLLVIYQYHKLKKQNYTLNTSAIELIKFKRSPKTIKSILVDTEKIKFPEGADQLLFGNQQATNVIRLVLSTTCSYCKKSFHDFHELYLRKGTEYQFQLIFNHYGDLASERNKTLAQLINTYSTDTQKDFLNTLKAVLEQQNTSNKGVHNTQYTANNSKVITDQRNWCERNGIFQTPILIINQTIMPEFYDASFIEDILAVENEKQ